MARRQHRRRRRKAPPEGLPPSSGSSSATDTSGIHSKRHSSSYTRTPLKCTNPSLSWWSRVWGNLATYGADIVRETIVALIVAALMAGAGTCNTNAPARHRSYAAPPEPEGVGHARSRATAERSVAHALVVEVVAL